MPHKSIDVKSDRVIVQATLNFLKLIKTRKNTPLFDRDIARLESDLRATP